MFIFVNNKKFYDSVHLSCTETRIRGTSVGTTIATIKNIIPPGTLTTLPANVYLGKFM